MDATVWGQDQRVDFGEVRVTFDVTAVELD
jgi:hypothetical protein